MAAVYRAWDAQVGAWRAIKVLLPEYANRPTLRGRFEREAATMARLSSPHIIRVFDVVGDEALPFMVMELAEGGTLVGWLDAYGRMPASLACDVVEQVASGLAVAHRHGVVHRDVKPHNVLITLDGLCKLTDFGIAQVRVSDRAAEMTRTGSTMGTIGYMAPEQRADAKTVDHRADVYGLGAVLFKLITGTIMSDLFLVEHEPELLDDIPEVLHEIVVRACYHDRERRFPTAEAFIETLRQVQAFLPTDPRDTPPLVIPATDTPTEAGQRPFPEIAVLLDAQTPISADSLAPTRPARDVPRGGLVTDEVTELRRPEEARGTRYTMPVQHPAANEPLYASIPPAPGATGDPEIGITSGSYALGSLPPAPSDAGAPPAIVEFDDDASFEAREAAVQRWSMVLGGISLFALLVMASSGLLVHRAVEASFVARDAFYDTLVDERAILEDLRQAGLDARALERLRGQYHAFEDATAEPDRIQRATAYVRELRSQARPVLEETAPYGLVRARATAIETAYGRAARAHNGALQATRTMPGRIAVKIGLVQPP